MRPAIRGAKLGYQTAVTDKPWEQQAKNWVAWARTPGHDAYWYYAPAFFENIVPPPGRATLEIGCGEGRVSRDLTGRGHPVTAIDSSPTLLAHARELDSLGTYVLADAAVLPFQDASFDCVVAYNSLMDFDDMAGATVEAARVLQPGGRLCICVTHPVGDAGSFDTLEANASFVIEGSYLGRRRFKETFERNGLTMTFSGWMYALQDYADALEAAGLLIERVREPMAPDGARWERYRRIPMFLHIRALKPAG